MNRIAVPGRNCWQLGRTEDASVIVDARDYYRAFYRTMLTAERYAFLAGWQFDSDVRLLRGDDAKDAPLPVELLPFLEALCQRRPELTIYVLAWDYSVVYTLEREWMQRVKFDFGSNERILYQLDGKHPLGASHHQKFVVVDGRVAFVGGADICDGRWDDRRHAAGNPERVNRYGEPYKPYHEVIACFSGPLVASVEQVFRERWVRAAGSEPSWPSVVPEGDDPPEIAFEGAIRIGGSDVAIARTLAWEDAEGDASVQEIRHLYEDAIAAAERLIYIETQYITSRRVHDALLSRLADAGRPRLSLVIVVPHGSDSMKEELALGAAEKELLASVARQARASGHTLRVLFSAAQAAQRDEPPTFIHSKVLIVDDRFMTLGSANCTNRSMSVDSELNLAWECGAEDEALSRTIAHLRASLLSEHAGVAHDPALERIDQIAARIDALLAGGSRLRQRPLPEPGDGVAASPLMQLAFDPEGPILQNAIEELLGQRNEKNQAAGDDSRNAGEPDPSTGAFRLGGR